MLSPWKLLIKMDFFKADDGRQLRALEDIGWSVRPRHDRLGLEDLSEGFRLRLGDRARATG